MWRQLSCVLTVLLMVSMAQAETVVDVTTSINAPMVANAYQLNLGETYTLSVCGQLKTSAATQDNGIYSWCVDLRVGDTDVLDLLVGTVDRSGWQNDSYTSSSGTSTAWGIQAIYDLSNMGDDNLGVDAAICLFTVNFTAANVGASVLTIEPNYKTGGDGGDFITNGCDMGGDYSVATATVNVVPEPQTLALMVSGLLVFSLFWTKRFR